MAVSAPQETPMSALAASRILSPLRNSTEAQNVEALVEEQLQHFSIDPSSGYGRALSDFTRHLYGANAAAHELWSITLDTLSRLDRADRIAYFNAKRFACFQLAKILDTLQNPMRAVYQSLLAGSGAAMAKGPYPIFDNVTALFSATPVIARTATYLYASIEWVEDAFKGKELLLEIYSRLLNPTSIALANHIVDLEAGPFANQYLAWNFNSGMAAIDAILSHLLGHRDVVLASRNIYGGTYQLLHDWYGKRANLDVGVEWLTVSRPTTSSPPSTARTTRTPRGSPKAGRSMSSWSRPAIRMATSWTSRPSAGRRTREG
jgi:O-acetylhomoserine (thiol)-lyase